MITDAQGLFLRYAAGAGGVEDAYCFDVSFNGGPTHRLLMDTGSPWMNIGSDLLPEGSYTVLDQQPDYAKPSYSSDGNTYEGEWVSTTVTVIGGDGNRFTTPQPIIVFRSTSQPGVAMMGVSTRYPDLDALNIFLNVPGIVDGSYRPGYILDQNGVFFGYDQATSDSFAKAPVSTALGQRTAAATVTLTPPAGKSLPTYTATLPLLMDTGIDYTIVTPCTNPPAPTPPDKTAWEVSETVTENGQAVVVVKLMPGVQVTVAVGTGAEGITWGFNTTQCGSAPVYPAMARLAAPSPFGIVNTGRHFLASYKYLVELSARQGASTGVMGFLKV